MEEFKAFTWSFVCDSCKQITFDISATYEVLDPKIVFNECNEGCVGWWWITSFDAWHGQTYIQNNKQFKMSNQITL